ncbi:MAG TPA: acetyl-CoA carboxylase biotin carboxyl carrier protein subunit [Williamwhitmania sp.]|nr:acetyl-CoA carboxylase biotin carboxyl carrier protein subunit [Williamwhitmania sp.]
MEKKNSKFAGPCAGADETASAAKCKTLVVQGTKYKTFLTPKYENRKQWVRINPKEIKSFIPGTVLQIFVTVGQKVKVDEPLLVYDAMKMHNTLKAPMDGTIKAILLKVTDRFPKGTLLVEFE